MLEFIGNELEKFKNTIEREIINPILNELDKFGNTMEREIFTPIQKTVCNDLPQSVNNVNLIVKKTKKYLNLVPVVTIALGASIVTLLGINLFILTEIL